MKENINKFYLRLFVSVIWILTFCFLYNLSAQSNSNSTTPKTSKDQSVLQTNNEIFDVKPEREINTDQFPIALIKFSVMRNDNKEIYVLKSQNIEAEIDKQPLEVKPDALTATSGEPVKILFMIDQSGSMKYEGKLNAAKKALKYFIKNLKKNDEIVLLVFDEEVGTIISQPTKVENISQTERSIDNIQASNLKYTYFYDAVDAAVGHAEKYNIDNIVFLSDGNEDNPDFNDLTYGEEVEFKKNREEKIINRLKNRRFFSIAIGNQEPYGNKNRFVDFKSMKNISDKNVSGKNASESSDAYLIDTPAIAKRADNDELKMEEIITDELKDVLDEIKEAIKFDYLLRLNLPQLNPDGGTLGLKLDLTDGKNRWVYQVDYPYSKKNGKWIFEKGVVKSPVFIKTAELSWADLSKIYLLFLSPLGLLAIIPSLFKKFGSLMDERRVSKSITVLRRNSEFIGKMCPNEFSGGNIYAFTAGDIVISCPKCNIVHHLQCWKESDSYCMNKHCQKRFIVPSKVLEKYNA